MNNFAFHNTLNWTVFIAICNEDDSCHRFSSNKEICDLAVFDGIWHELLLVITIPCKHTGGP